MELSLPLTIENLDKRLRSFTRREGWRIAVYSVDRTQHREGKPFLRRVEWPGSAQDEVIEFVANAAWLTRTTIVGDVAKIAESLREPSEIKKYHLFGVSKVAAGVSSGNARGSVVAAPCFDPRQTITSDRAPRGAIGVIAVAGDLPTQEVVANDSLRYLIEQYATAVASFLDAQPKDQEPFFSEWTLPDIEIVPTELDLKAYSPGDMVIEPVHPTKVRTYSRLEVFPNEAVRITGYSNDFEPYATHGEKWLQFGPGLAVSRAGLEAFVRGWTQRKADRDYVRKLDYKG